MTIAEQPAELSAINLERMLDQLGLATPVPVSRQGLEEVYGAWCRTVPFDNILRRIQIPQGSNGQLPGCTPDGFVLDHVRHGVGGQCVPASLALGALLRALGFEAWSTLAAIEHAGQTPDHVTVVASIGGIEYLVDTVILCERPIPLVQLGGGALEHALHPVTVTRDGGRWQIEYVAAMTRLPATCTVIDGQADTRTCLALYQATQESATIRQFNAGLYIRRNGPATVSVLCRDRYVKVSHAAWVDRRVGPATRRQLLLDVFQLSDQIVSRLPTDDA